MDDIFDFILGGIVIIFIAAIIYSILDYGLGTDKAMSGIVVDKAYTASSTNVGVGPAVGGSGGVAVVTTSTPEKYTLFVRQGDGKVAKIPVDSNKWLRLKNGDKVDYTVRVGKWSHSFYAK